MSETRTEKFERVAAPRIENVTKGLELLQNLGRSEYEATQERKREIIEGFTNGVIALAISWRLDMPEITEAATVIESESLTKAASAIDAVGSLTQQAGGGAAVESEIRWAIDLIARGEYETADSRLRRCLESTS